MKITSYKDQSTVITPSPRAYLFLFRSLLKISSTKSPRIRLTTVARDKGSRFDFHKKTATNPLVEASKSGARESGGFKRILIQSFGRESRQGHRTGSIVC